jgi:hypothetical protein
MWITLDSPQNTPGKLRVIPSLLLRSDLLFLSNLPLSKMVIETSMAKSLAIFIISNIHHEEYSDAWEGK